MKLRHVQKAIQTLRRNRRAGVALIVAMCAAALLFGLSLSLIFSASMPMATANQKIADEQCYQLAKSFSQVLDTELRAYTDEASAPDTSFYRYANKLLEGVYGEYDPDHPELTTFYYSAFGNPEDPYGKITVNLRKESAQGENDVITSGSFLREDSDAYTKEVSERTFIQYLFCVDVTARTEDGSYTYTTEYFRKTCFQPQYWYNNNRVYYDENSKNWYRDNTFLSSVSIDNWETIYYTYDESVVVSKIFQPTYLEGG